MAFSLVKDDGDVERGQQLTAELWGEIREWLDTAYPDAVIVPEGKEPRTGAPLAFHADFFLVIHQPHSSLFNNGGAGTLPANARQIFYAARPLVQDLLGAEVDRPHDRVVLQIDDR